MVIDMSDIQRTTGFLSPPRPARAFVSQMHGYGVSLNVFVKLFKQWSNLTIKERQEVYDICELEHPGTYHGIFPKEEDYADSGDP